VVVSECVSEDEQRGPTSFFVSVQGQLLALELRSKPAGHANREVI
jgi:hypothetical protein